MKYNPFRSNQSYTLYLASALYVAILVVILSLGLLEQTPVLWVYLVVSSIGEIYFIICSMIEYVEYWKGNKLIILDDEITFFDKEKQKQKTIKIDDLLEFHYQKKGQIDFVYKNHGRTDFLFVAHVFSKKECEILESIINRISRRDAKVNLFNE